MQPILVWTILALSAALCAGSAMLWRQSRRKTRQKTLPAEWALSARPVFSTEERRAYRQLREALPHHIVLAKLPLVRFCQPVDPQDVRYWYDLLGGAHVSFAICSGNGRVLAAIDLDGDRSPSRRSSQIKQSVLAACRVRYLRCPADHLPSIPELQLLVPQATTAARGPQASAAADYRLRDPAMAALPREFTTLWQDSAALQDSFFGTGNGRETGTSHVMGNGNGNGQGHGFAGFRTGGYGGHDAMVDLEDIGGVVIETPHDLSDMGLPDVIEDPVTVLPPIPRASELRH